jgi:hypothetical protein
MYHSEINNRPDVRLRFVQLWFFPEALDLPPSVEQREVDRQERTDRWLPVVSSRHAGALPLRADAAVLASSLGFGQKIRYELPRGRGLYLYVLEGGPVTIAGQRADALSAVEIRGQGSVETSADRHAELLLLDVNLSKAMPAR